MTNIEEVKINELQVMNNSRVRFTKDHDVKELMVSLEQVGMVQPITVRKEDKDAVF